MCIMEEAGLDSGLGARFSSTLAMLGMEALQAYIWDQARPRVIGTM